MCLSFISKRSCDDACTYAGKLGAFATHLLQPSSTPDVVCESGTSVPPSVTAGEARKDHRCEIAGNKISKEATDSVLN